MLAQLRRLPLIVTVTLLLLFATTAGAADPAATIAQLEIIAVDATQFPEVTLSFRAPSASGQLQTTDILLTENEQPVETFTLSSEEKIAPVSLLLVIDQGLYSVSRYNQNYDKTQLKHLFYLLGDHFLRTDVDAVGLMVGRRDPGTNDRQESQILLLGATTPVTWTRTLDALDLDLSGNGWPRNSFQPVDTTTLLTDAIAAMSGAHNPVIIYVSQGIHAPLEPGPDRARVAAERLAAKAQAADVRIFTFQTAAHTVSNEIREPLKVLAENSGGVYVELYTDKDNESAVTAVYHDIWLPHVTYLVRYRSQDGLAGERIVALAVASSPQVTAQATYTITLDDPVIEAAQVEPMTDGRYQLNLALAWPDGRARQIANVFINNTPLETFTIDEDGLLQAELSDPATGIIEVRVQDELGRSSSPRDATMPSRQPAENEAPAPVTPDVEEPNAPGVPTTFLWVLSWVGLVAAAVYIVVQRRRGLFPHVTGHIGQGARRLTTILGGGRRREVLAYLHVLAAGGDLVGETLELHTDITTLGRDPQLSDIQLFEESERSSVSGQHCTIQFDQGAFWLLDNNSTNGTAVNGIPLAPDDPYRLQDDDEIELGEKGRREARLRFTIAERIKQRHSATITDRAWPGTPRTGKVTQIPSQDTGVTPETPLPVLEDDEDWLQKLE